MMALLAVEAVFNSDETFQKRFKPRFMECHHHHHHHHRPRM